MTDTRTAVPDSTSGPEAAPTRRPGATDQPRPHPVAAPTGGPELSGTQTTRTTPDNPRATGTRASEARSVGGATAAAGTPAPRAASHADGVASVDGLASVDDAAPASDVPATGAAPGAPRAPETRGRAATSPGGVAPAGDAHPGGSRTARPAAGGSAAAPVAFVVPVALATPGAPVPELLRATLDSVLAQTDPGRRLYLVGPAGARAEVAAALGGRRPSGGAPVTLCEVPPGTAVGRARDVAVDAARQDGCGFAAFLDPGDRAHPERVAAARAAFAADPELDLVYGDFEPIDERGDVLRPERLPRALRVTYRQQLDLAPVEGREGWVRQAVDRECLALPATRTVRIALATRFPAARAGEPGGADTATLLRYLGGGAVIAHLPGVPTGLLVPPGAERRPDPAEAARARAAERAALEEAIALARARGAADEWFGRVVLCRYLLRLSRAADAEGRHEDALALVREARDRAPRTFAKYATLEERSWLPRPGMSRVA